MEDINGVPMDDYLGPTFSINQHDSDGDIYDCGIYLHYGHTSIRVAKNMRGFKAHIKHLQGVADEIEENLPEQKLSDYTIIKWKRMIEIYGKH